MSGGYFDSGWQGDGGPCPVCGLDLNNSACRCLSKRVMTFDEFLAECRAETVEHGSGEWAKSDEAEDSDV